MNKSKTLKKVVRKTRKQVVKKSKPQVFYALMEKDSMNTDMYTAAVFSMKDDHINHSINSFMQDGMEDLEEMVAVRIEVLGKPSVKREITIKK